MHPINHVILFVIDDLRADQFNSLLNKGFLPNIKEYLTNGITCENSIASYPAITYPAQSTMLTGCYPDSYQFPGGHWVKRDEKIICNYNSYSNFDTVNEELGTNVKTIFELVKGSTAGLSIGLVRGASHFYPTRRQIVSLYLWYLILLRRDMRTLNKLVMNKLLDYFNKPKKFFKEGPPRLSVAWFLSSDSFLHNYGSNSEIYLQNLKDIDQKIGELIHGTGKRKGLKELGCLEDTAFILTSDHGNFTAKKWVDIAPYFDQIGLIPLIPKKQDGNFDATMGSLGFFNLRGATWQERPTIAQMQDYGPRHVDLIHNALLNIPGVRYLYYREDANTPESGLIHVLKKESDEIYHATIEYQKDKTKYTYDKKDIFDYSKDELAAKILNEKFHSIDEWLMHTYHLDFPMVIDQVARLFRNPNSCDIMISTCGETSFNYEHGKTKNNHIHGHDIALHSAITVPQLISSPYIASKTIPFSKSTDIVPLILKLLGEPIPSNLIGKSLV
ncbi:MAG TPA: alkaline phosphatase family protein [Candidatus Deferrimicrobium sp.]|nr:alkaline phosphatase family protein [Candidatus Deferrimicrobium sp.]